MLNLRKEEIENNIIYISSMQITPSSMKRFYEFVKDSLYDCRISRSEIKEAKYHHNTSYNKAHLLIKNGILSFKEQSLLENRIITKEELIKYNDDYHVNGLSQISLATLDIDHSAISKNEWLYNPHLPSEVDIRISSHVKAYRNSINYANEYLVNGKVSKEDFRAIDIRILKLISDYFKDDNSAVSIIKKYNALREIASELINSGLDIPLREMSNENITLDPKEVIKIPKLIFKK